MGGFVIAQWVPGDAVDILLAERSYTADGDQLRRNLGFDRPLLERWWLFFSDAVRGDLGHSLLSGEPVVDMITSRLGATGLLAIAAITIAVVIAIPAALLSARWAGSGLDQIGCALAVIGLSIPNFVLGPMLMIVFAIKLGWLPVAGAGEPRSLILPAVTLGISLAALLFRMTRASCIEVLSRQHIQAARAKGLRESSILCWHVLPNTALVLVTVLGLQLGALLSGAVITEIVFSWPGIGTLLIDAIQRRDFPVIQGTVLFVAVVYIAINLITDLIYGFCDPRITVR
ncbi:MAG: ABC transporter permease [Pseudomonadota bacterium]